MEEKALAVTLQNLQEEFGRTQELLHLIASDYQNSLDANRLFRRLKQVDTLISHIQQQISINSGYGA